MTTSPSSPERLRHDAASAQRGDAPVTDSAPQEPSRLNASGSKPPCLECGRSLQQGKAIFCCAACRLIWNNRRLRRGAELYDIMMAHRFERVLAAQLKALSAMNRLAAIFRAEDRHDRDGRRSWRPLREVLLDRPGLKTMTTQIRAGR